VHTAPRRFVISGLAVAALLVGGVSAQLPLGLMTFNIRTAYIDDGENAWPNRKALVAQTIERSAPDVVGLQEVIREQVDYLAATLDGYRWIGVDRGLNGGEGLSEYTPIFYRFAELSPIEPAISGCRRRLIFRARPSRASAAS
jgi:hypothetical protein